MRFPIPSKDVLCVDSLVLTLALFCRQPLLVVAHRSPQMLPLYIIACTWVGDGDLSAWTMSNCPPKLVNKGHDGSKAQQKSSGLT